MKNLDEIYEYVNDVTTILVINNTSKLLLDSLYNSIYNKYSASKCKCNTRNHLMRKFSVIKSKLIRVDFDLKNAQFSSSTANSKTTEDFKLLKSYLIENNSKILFKTDLSYLGETHTKILEILKFQAFRLIPQYRIFDLVILIDQKDVLILNYQTDSKSYSLFNNYGNKENMCFNIDSLVRKVKLSKIGKMYNKESL